MNDGFPVYILNTDWKGICVAAALAGFTSAFTVFFTLRMSRSGEESKKDRENLYDLYKQLTRMTIFFAGWEEMSKLPLSSNLNKAENEFDIWLDKNVPREKSLTWLVVRKVDYEIQWINKWSPEKKALENAVTLRAEAESSYDESEKQRHTHSLQDDFDDFEQVNGRGGLLEQRQAEWADAQWALIRKKCEILSAESESMRSEAAYFLSSPSSWRGDLRVFSRRRRLSQQVRDSWGRLNDDRQNQHGK